MNYYIFLSLIFKMIWQYILFHKASLKDQRLLCKLPHTLTQYSVILTLRDHQLIVRRQLKKQHDSWKANGNQLASTLSLQCCHIRSQKSHWHTRINKSFNSVFNVNEARLKRPEQRLGLDKEFVCLFMKCWALSQVLPQNQPLSPLLRRKWPPPCSAALILNYHHYPYCSSNLSQSPTRSRYCVITCIHTSPFICP